MSITDSINRILKINDSYQAPQRLMDLLTGDKAERDHVFKEMAYLFDHDYSFDWFHEYFQNEHADRKEKKQDFTPESVSKLLNRMVGDNPGSTMDVASGTGGLLITRWHEDRMQTNPFTYRPSDYLYHAEELSDRSVPFLLFNLIIRGMNATVMHGNALTRECYGIFFIQNDYDDHMLYSSLNVFPYTENIAQQFAVKFVEEKYPHIIQTPGIPKHIIEPKDRTKDESAWELTRALCGVEKLPEVQTPQSNLNGQEELQEKEEIPAGQMDIFGLLEN
ncbi:N-6 DNA methylase [Salinicoccus roseus]|uniref:N-6 DNA methylase n=1 Tax=Salinicoccus roseus TaxID=45670 RepID=UPI0023003AC0|nr:N-6 DNA methylase [Salinicoccus roseus]